MWSRSSKDLLHLERGRQRLDQHRRPDRAVRDADVVLAEREDVVPQLRLLRRLDLRQVEVRADAVVDQALRVVEEVQAEVDERAGCGEVRPARSVNSMCFSTRCQPRGRITIVGCARP
jgi:hypothetical protein